MAINNFLTKEDYNRILEITKWNLALFFQINIDFEVEIYVLVDKKLNRPVRRINKKTKLIFICISDLQNYEAMTHIIYGLILYWIKKNVNFMEKLKIVRKKHGIAMWYAREIMLKYKQEKIANSLKELIGCSYKECEENPLQKLECRLPERFCIMVCRIRKKILNSLSKIANLPMI